MPKLSIITINYNNLEGLKRTIESVVNQTWQEFEYIVIDGGSSDGSAAYIESQINKIDYSVSEKDAGIYNAMNKGIKVANGEYLLFLNSGDHFYDLEVLKKNYKHLEGLDLVYFDLNICESNRSFVRNFPVKLSFSFLFANSLPHPATFINRRLFIQNGFYDESLKIVSDWKFFVECLCTLNCSYKKVDAVLSTFYFDGRSSNPENRNLINAEVSEILDSKFSLFIEDTKNLEKQNIIFESLRRSKSIKLLIKLGLINKF